MLACAGNGLGAHVPPRPEAMSLHSCKLANPQPRIPEESVRQKSSALALGIVIATNASANSAAADAVVIFKCCFISFSLVCI